MGVGGEHDKKSPLLETVSSSSCVVESYLKPTVVRTGNEWTAVAHIITGVIGSGVLSLSWSMAQLGWVAGPLCMLLFAFINIISTTLQSNCYRSPDPEFGSTRNPSYVDAVDMILGKWSKWICGFLVRIIFFQIAVVYIITTGTSMRAIEKSNCYHMKGHSAACEYDGGNISYMLLFGLIQIVTSQIPDFRNTQWLSIVAATMSFIYAIIGSSFGVAKAIGDGKVRGSITGVPTDTTAQKVWLVSQAVGDIVFAFPFSFIFLEIQDTLKSPPAEIVTMKKASAIGLFIITFFYLCCGGTGYAAFGDSTPGNLLTGFYEPYWLIDLANVCIVIHLVGAYQSFSQPVFVLGERWIADMFPECRMLYVDHTLKLPSLPAIRLSLLRLCFRTAYVACTTVTAIAFPYFNQVVGMAGAVGFWPNVIHFPVEMYLVQRNVRSWTWKWVLLRGYSFLCLLISIFALVGSVEGLISAKFGNDAIHSHST